MAIAEPDDHEEGEITDDEEAVAEPTHALQEEDDAPEGNYDGGRLEDEEGEENDEAVAAAAEAEARRARRERKRPRRTRIESGTATETETERGRRRGSWTLTRRRSGG